MSASVVVIWLILMNYDINHHAAARYDYKELSSFGIFGGKGNTCCKISF